MKRALSSELVTKTNKKIASIKNEMDQKSSAAAAAAVAPKLKRSNTILLSSDEESEINVIRSPPKLVSKSRRSINVNEKFIHLKKMFPNIPDGLILEYLNVNKYKTNCLKEAIDHFSSLIHEYSNMSIGSDTEENDEKIIPSDNNNNNRPMTSSAANANENLIEINFIQSLFSNISTSTALEIIQNVNNMTNVSNETTRESLLVDYVINNNLNETAPPSPMQESISLEEDLEKVQAIIVDADPSFLKQKLEFLSTSNKRVELLIAELIESKTYPKLKDYLSKIKKQNEIDQLVNAPLNIDEFLKIIPEPFNYFYKNEKEKSESYKIHCRIELSNSFDFLAEESINDVFTKQLHRLTPTYRQLEMAVKFKERELKQRAKNNVAMNLSKRNLTLETAPKQFLDYIPKAKFTKNYIQYKLENFPREKKQYPDILDPSFFRELQFIKNEDRIKAFIIQKDDMRRQRFEKAKLENTLLECPCCFDDELLDDDMLACPDGHIFCKECVKRYTETSIGDSKYMFNCINDKCKREFEMSTLSNVLEPNMFSKVLRNIQNEEIKKAGIENLESCKYCTYAAIIENPEEKVFRCLNPDCLKETCRQCNEPNHLPLRCNEIEKSDEVSMRTWIENRVTEAMIRQCHKCSKRFFKVEGCNMMHCVCGASMCYLCRKPTSDYKHFQEGTCKQYSDIEELHQIEMEKAYKEANELYLKDHPDAASIKLKYDPKKILDDLNKEKEKLKKQQQLHMAQIQIGQIANLNNRNVNIIHNGRHYNNVEQLMQHLNQNVNQHLLNVNMHMNIMQQQRANLNQQVNQQLQRANQQIQQANQQIQRARPVLPAAPANNPN